MSNTNNARRIIAALVIAPMAMLAASGTVAAKGTGNETLGQLAVFATALPHGQVSVDVRTNTEKLGGEKTTAVPDGHRLHLASWGGCALGALALAEIAIVTGPGALLVGCAIGAAIA